VGEGTRVLSLCEYLTGADRHPDHVAPYQLVRAVKGLPFDGHAWITVGGARRRFDSERPQVAMAWAVERLAESMFAAYRSEPITLVPLPGHAHTTAADVETGCVHRLGLALSATLRRRGMVVHSLPLLHWRTPVGCAREGGTRDPHLLQPRLRVAVAVADSFKVIVIDDVVTTGGHIIAAQSALAAAGYDVADIAFTVGRSVFSKGDPFAELLEKCPRHTNIHFVAPAIV
jgi:hypothetical protein